MLRAQNCLKAAENELAKFTDEAASLCWDLLCTVPPLVCAQPPHFHQTQHHRELSPLWNKSLQSFKLIYYQPVLFSSCEGQVAKKGSVGNREKSVPSFESPEEELTVPALRERSERDSERDTPQQDWGHRYSTEPPLLPEQAAETESSVFASALESGGESQGPRNTDHEQPLSLSGEEGKEESRYSSLEDLSSVLDSGDLGMSVDMDYGSLPLLRLVNK